MTPAHAAEIAIVCLCTEILKIVRLGFFTLSLHCDHLESFKKRITLGASNRRQSDSPVWKGKASQVILMCSHP